MAIENAEPGQLADIGAIATLADRRAWLVDIGALANVADRGGQLTDFGGLANVADRGGQLTDIGGLANAADRREKLQDFIGVAAKKPGNAQQAAIVLVRDPDIEDPIIEEESVQSSQKGPNTDQPQNQPVHEEVEVALGDIQIEHNSPQESPQPIPRDREPSKISCKCLLEFAPFIFWTLQVILTESQHMYIGNQVKDYCAEDDDWCEE